MVGCRASYSPSGGGFIPILDAHRQGTVKGIFVAGDAAGPCAQEVAIAEGHLAGLAATSIGIGDPREAALDQKPANASHADRFSPQADEHS